MVHGRLKGLLRPRGCGQGERLLLYGGEREVLHMEDSLESQDQDEVDCVPLSDVALLDPALNLWVPITLAGEFYSGGGL